MQLQSMYQEIILAHYRNPKNKGLREPYDAQVHHVNPTCGDEVTLRVTLRDAGGEPAVSDVSYDALGCSISQASASMMTEMIIGKTVREAMDLSGEFLALMQSRGEGEPDEDVLGDAVAFEGVSRYPARIKCALLGWMAWKDATTRALDRPAGPHAGNGHGRASNGRSGEQANGQQAVRRQPRERLNDQAGNGNTGSSRTAADVAREQQ
jgi:nitrogen fixation protein NifU and related proteins